MATKKDKVEGFLREIESTYEFWHDSNEDAYVTVERGLHLRVKSHQFRYYIKGAYYKKYGEPLGSEHSKSIIDIAEAKAIYDGEEHDVHVRVAYLDGSLFWDQGDGQRSAIQVSKNGIERVLTPPVRFLRSPRYGSIGRVARVGSGEDLTLVKRLLPNVGDPGRKLIMGFQLTTLASSRSHLVLFLTGNQGSGKSLIGHFKTGQGWAL